MATVIASDVFGLTTRMVGLSICALPVNTPAPAKKPLTLTLFRRERG
jgi:hypothetical protein